MKISLVLLVAILVFSCSGKAMVLTEVDPVDNWEYQAIAEATPESQGVDSEILNQTIKSLEYCGTDGIVVLRHGKKIFEQYREPFTSDMTHNIFSITKSVNATLIGIAIDQGYIESVDTRVLDIFPEYKKREENPVWNAMTIADLLTMSAGMPKDSSEADVWNMMLEDNWLDYIFDIEPLDFTFRNKFLYSNLSSCLLSAILAKSTGYSPLDYARMNLFNPLGITQYSWDYQSPSGVQSGASFLNLRTEDLAKIGQLYLDRGIWNGKRVVSEEWIEASMMKPEDIHNRLAYGYGFQWWLDRDGSYSGRGSLGQVIKVYPEQDMVVAIESTINYYNAALINKIYDPLSSDFLKSLSDNPLDPFSRMEVSGNEDEKMAASYEFPEMDKDFELSKNPLGFDTLKFNHRDSLYQFSLSIWGSDEVSLSFEDSELGQYIEFSEQKDVLDFFEYSKKMYHPEMLIAKQWVFSRLTLVEDNSLLLKIRTYPGIQEYNIEIKTDSENTDVKITDIMNVNAVSLRH